MVTIMKVCNVCGHIIHYGSLTCPVCGNKIKADKKAKLTKDYSR